MQNQIEEIVPMDVWSWSVTFVLYPLYMMGLQSIFYLIFLGGGLPEALQIEDAL